MKRYIYAYSSQDHYEDRKSRGLVPLVKVGDTFRDVDSRIKEQDNASNPFPLKKLQQWEIPNNYRDYDIHVILEKMEINRPREDREWFECDVDTIACAVNELVHGKIRPDNWSMRKEQKEAVDKAVSYFSHGGTEFLLNCKMRFGKTHVAYQIGKGIKAKKVLVITYKPAVDTEWENGLNRHIEFGGYVFLHAMDFDKNNPIKFNGDKTILFASFQDMLGKDENKDFKKKWRYIRGIEFDLIVVDEVHYGASTPRATNLIEQLKFKKKLVMSGTPLELLMCEDYSPENTYTWSYIDEQIERNKEKKSGWKTTYYKWLPPLSVHTYELGESVIKDAKYYDPEEGLTLNKFFYSEDGETLSNVAAVNRWLDILANPNDRAVCSPFNNNRMAGKLNVMFWYLESVNGIKALRKLLESHPFFSKYCIVVAAGDNDGEGKDTLALVKKTIKNNDKVIILSCGKLNTGVTIPQLTTVFMLCDTASAEDYWQTVFRVQSPWEKGNKLECFCIDFSPNRCLRMVYDYQDILAKKGQGTVEGIRQLLEVMKVYSYEDNRIVEMTSNNFDKIIEAGINPEKAIGKFESSRLINSMKVTDSVIDLLRRIPASQKKSKQITICSSQLTNGKNFLKRKMTKSEKREILSIASRAISVCKMIPTFIVASSHKEECLENVFHTQNQKLFKSITGVSISEFEMMVNVGFINFDIMNRAVQSFYLLQKKCDV